MHLPASESSVTLMSELLVLSNNLTCPIISWTVCICIIKNINYYIKFNSKSKKILHPVPMFNLPSTIVSTSIYLQFASSFSPKANNNTVFIC